MEKEKSQIARFHLPGLFEFYEFYKEFLPLYSLHREYFYDWVTIASIYGAPDDCLWSGGRLGQGDTESGEVMELLERYGISARLTFSNSLLQEHHLSDKKCNRLCKMLEEATGIENGVIVHSELLTRYIRKNYPKLYLVSSTTKVLTDSSQFTEELRRDDFRYIVPDFRLNKQWTLWNSFSQQEKEKVEFLCNECCYVGCKDRKACYENVSRRVLDENCPDFVCNAPNASEGYVFSKAMQNPAFISIEDIHDVYLQAGFSNFKLEGRSLGSAILLEFLLYYMVKPKYQLQVREAIYLDSMLNLF